MRWSNSKHIKSIFIAIITVLSFVSCNIKDDEKKLANKNKQEEVSVNDKILQVAEKNSLPKMEETFPFSEAEKIEIISYPVRYEWDTIRNKEGYKTTVGIVKDKKLQVNPVGIKDRVVVNYKTVTELFKLLIIEPTPPDCSMASCFDPRHSILFYNKHSEIIANIEICFDCGQAYTSEGFKINEVCYEKMGKLIQIFKNAGVKYYGQPKK